MSICLETEDDERAWQDYVSRAVGFLELYSYLADAYILDFFVDGSWSSLPDGWRHTLDAWPAERLADFIADDDTGTPGGRTWPSVAPLSLLCYRAGCRALSLRRRPLPSPRPVADFLRRCSGGRLPAGDPAAAAAEQWPADAAAELSAAGGQLAALHHVFRRHVKPKKQHELRRLARLVELTAPPLVVDLGSGRGHLSRYLAYGSRRPVVCLEANAAFVNGARKLDEQLEQSLQKKELPLPARPLHSACHITEDMDHRKFAEMLSSLTGAPTQSLRFTALGLHTCGDLAALLLRQFVRSPQCGAVVSVGCCYMKLSTAAGGWRGYPLSGHVAAAAAARRYHMSYEAREVACHAIEEYAARLRAGGEEHLKIHAYRAALERILVRWDPNLRHTGLRGVNKGHTLPFHEYVRRALARVPVDPDQLDLSSAADDLAQWRRVVAFYSLRLMLAPVVESVLLLDRMLYLREHGHPSILVPAFDPRLSPRNFVLVAQKR